MEKEKMIEEKFKHLQEMERNLFVAEKQFEKAKEDLDSVRKMTFMYNKK
jgi:hypothetical protein